MDGLTNASHTERRILVKQVCCLQKLVLTWPYPMLPPSLGFTLTTRFHSPFAEEAKRASARTTFFIIFGMCLDKRRDGNLRTNLLERGGLDWRRNLLSGLSLIIIDDVSSLHERGALVCCDKRERLEPRDDEGWRPDLPCSKTV